jgi:hypothetical protein
MLIKGRKRQTAGQTALGFQACSGSQKRIGREGDANRTHKNPEHVLPDLPVVRRRLGRENRLPNHTGERNRALKRP